MTAPTTQYRVTNPATGEIEREFPTATDDQIAEALAHSHAAFQDWGGRKVAERAQVMTQVAQLIEQRLEELAVIITREMGKRIKEARGELQLCVDIFRFYADHAEKFLADEPLHTATGGAILQKRPIGPVLGIMPWNYPYYQVARFAAPNLVLGNTILLKHAPNCPESSAALEALLHEAGVPQSAYINLYATHDQVATIIADPRVQGVSLTGSERAGAAVAELAGKHLKKVVLELGGSDACLVLDSEDVGQTARGLAAARLSNTGQACNSPKRMIVLDPLYEDFVQTLTNSFSQAATRAGDPADEATKLAPMSSEAARQRLTEQVDDTVAAGATLVTGGHALDGPGAYYAPTVLTDVAPGMRAYHEELFGPVATVFRVADVAEAVALANDTEFGLGASVFTHDEQLGRTVANQIHTGMVYLNQAGGSQADMPFGGVKRSGVGRELGELGIEEFMNKKVLKL